MRRVLIGCVVCVLAIGAMGAAFATDLDFAGIGALSSGTEDVPQANVDEIYWGLEVDDPKDEPWIANVRLSFDQYLYKGTVIAVYLTDDADVEVGFGKLTTSADIPASANNTSVPVTDGGGHVVAAGVYNIRVTVGEPYPAKP